MIYPFSSLLYQDEAQCVDALLRDLAWPDDLASQVHEQAVLLVEKTRQTKGKGGQLEAFLQEFSLNTDEGLAMMTLAEALLRIPDAKTANELIRDKVAAASWLERQGSSKDWMAKAAGFGMALTRKTLDSSLARLGEPIIREAMIKAMQMMGKQFVLGTSIEDALTQARYSEAQGYRMSYDILGEGARDKDTAERYFKCYSDAIDAVGAHQKTAQRKSGVSVKLSALHPRYSYAQKDNCVPAMIEKLEFLAHKAANYGLPLTVDAEESARLEISLQVIEPVLRAKGLSDWGGFGMAVQAYSKRAAPLIDYLAQASMRANRRMQVRLVKGAYWDSEIKRAQMDGLPNYPVFTRKCNTDVSYLACAAKLFKAHDTIYPMFATHNAHTVAAIVAMANGKAFEFQKLHGMGDGLYAQVLAQSLAPVSVYAPVGPHQDLLPYLVRRLLENGANSSFVNQLLDKLQDAASIVQDPIAQARSHKDKTHTKIPLPKNIFGTERLNSAGLDLNDPVSSQEILSYVAQDRIDRPQFSIVEGKRFEQIEDKHIDRCFENAGLAFEGWGTRSSDQRAKILEAIAHEFEIRRKELIALLVHEAGKTLSDAVAEVREAVDFCRYYAAQGRKDFNEDGLDLSGYTGESNRLVLQGRGVFVAISPWNFPLAIFTGQIVAALMAGNTVIAKPASQTRAIATFATELMHKAGVPADALHLLLGDGAYGAKIVAHKDVAGVVFTGSTATAKSIQLTLAQKDGPIVPLIAETGGQNAMIVDSSALPEQVVDDALLSAFGSAGQRCSALRVLFLQNEIADHVITVLKGAMAELDVDDPRLISSDIGPVIDHRAKDALQKHHDYLMNVGRHIATTPAPETGNFFSPTAWEIPNLSVLTGEVFGPILHVIRYDASALHDVIKSINAAGYGLTFGLHTRIQSKVVQVAKAVRAGNIYVNRSMIGAVVGIQPFGGMGLSGTGPKAGGPNYLHRFATEKHISINTTAAGGNASLVMLED